MLKHCRHELFTHLWKGRTNHEGISDDPLIDFVKNISLEEASKWAWDFKIPAKPIMEYIAQVMCWRRLCMLDDAGDGFSCSDYWQKHILCLDPWYENWGAEATLGFENFGPKIHALLQVKLDGDKESEEWKEAYKLTWRLLSGSCMQKVTHGKGLTFTVNLGTLLDENEGTDTLPGTFGELMRYGAVHFRQTRDTLHTLEPEKPPVIVKKGVLEP